MFQCASEPPPPPVTNESDIEAGLYVKELALAGRDCRGQLDTVENHLEINGITITDTLVVEEKKPKKRFGLF